MDKVAILGLGTMGGPTASALAGEGREVVGFDPAPEARTRAAERGVLVTSDVREAVDHASLVVVSVPRPENVRELVESALAPIRRGAVVVDLSTIDPDTARHAADTLAGRGATYIDAPVLGRPAGCGSWTLVAGGAAEVVDHVRPTLEATIASRVVCVGGVGSGSVVKILNNLMFGAINAVTAEALHLCRNSGIAMDVFVDAIVESGAATVSNLFRDIGPRIAAGDDDPVFALDLLSKDNVLAADLARAAGVDAPMATAVAALNARAVDLGYGPRDSSAVVQAYSDGGAP